MRINQISSFNSNVYQKTHPNNTSFKGIVNGRYYRDEIIEAAKKALKDPNWKDRMLAKKRTLEESFATWHKRGGDNDLAGRVLMGIFTLGITEVTWGLSQAAMDAQDNHQIDKDIEEIERCIDDLGGGGNGGSTSRGADVY